MLTIIHRSRKPNANNIFVKQCFPRGMLSVLCFVIQNRRNCSESKVKSFQWFRGSVSRVESRAVKVERIYYVRERAGIIKTSRQRRSKNRSRLSERQTLQENSLLANCYRNWVWFSHSLSRYVECNFAFFSIYLFDNLHNFEKDLLSNSHYLWRWIRIISISHQMFIEAMTTVKIQQYKILLILSWTIKRALT